MVNIAWFVTPHGYGHAARAAAIMLELKKQRPDATFHIFTTIPGWFFSDSGITDFVFHELRSDIGIIQKDALTQDLEATLTELADFIPFNDNLLDSLAHKLSSADCSLVAADIAPLGIAAADRAELPCVLIENFTWDWIYEPLAEKLPGFREPMAYFASLFERADYHIRTIPFCSNIYPADITTAPVARSPRSNRRLTRAALGVSESTNLVLITMGGTRTIYPFMEQLISENYRNTVFVVPGTTQHERHKNVIYLPHKSPFFHPDLVLASDAVIGKVGYSTAAEIYLTGAVFGAIERHDFRESAVVSRFVSENLQSCQISPAEFNSGQWLTKLPGLLTKKRTVARDINGASDAASFIAELISSTG